MAAFREEAVPFDAEMARIMAETQRVRKVQNGSEVYNVSLNQAYLQSLNLLQQGAPTTHAVTQRPVVLRHPAYIVFPAEEVEL